MSKYISIAMATIIVSLFSGLAVMFNKYDSVKEELAKEKASKFQLQKELDYQNEKIHQLTIDTEQFKKDYDEFIHNKSKDFLKNVKNIEDCNTVLFLLESDF